jgi:hypothetical protein
MASDSPLPTRPVNRFGECLASHADFVCRFVGRGLSCLYARSLSDVSSDLVTMLLLLSSEMVIGVGFQVLGAMRLVVAPPNV